MIRDFNLTHPIDIPNKPPHNLYSKLVTPFDSGDVLSEFSNDNINEIEDNKNSEDYLNEESENELFDNNLNEFLQEKVEEIDKKVSNHIENLKS